MSLFSSGDDRSSQPAPSGFSREVIDDVWSQAETIPGNDSGLWRKDSNGAWINRLDYGKRNTQFGWVILETASELRPVQWETAPDDVATEEDGKDEEDGMLF